MMDLRLCSEILECAKEMLHYANWASSRKEAGEYGYEGDLNDKEAPQHLARTYALNIL